ncbi:MAG: succinate dehydrogenase iron-sulfur subunit [Deltaproteobacteria bacterium]|nr:succinate dehydrogenase iron-sulfur subunit [Deltaproteobacteria bacterium]
MIRSNYYTFKILRYDAKDPLREPYFQSYHVKVVSGLTVLSVLNRIRDEIDGTLAFRASCRSAICGSCAMVINGKIDLACRTQVATFESDTVILEPLPNFEVMRDLVVDMTPFWEMYEQVQPYLIRESAVPEKEIYQSEKDRKKIDQFVNCILCACCYGACPVIADEPGYLGPAAAAKLERFILDSRDERPADSLESVNTPKGVWACRTVFRCIDACPKDVRPTDAIVNLRKNLVKNRFNMILGSKKK